MDKALQELQEKIHIQGEEMIEAKVKEFEDRFVDLLHTELTKYLKETTVAKNTWSPEDADLKGVRNEQSNVDPRYRGY